MVRHIGDDGTDIERVARRRNQRGGCGKNQRGLNVRCGVCRAHGGIVGRNRENPHRAVKIIGHVECDATGLVRGGFDNPGIKCHRARCTPCKRIGQWAHSRCAIIPIATAGLCKFAQNVVFRQQQRQNLVRVDLQGGFLEEIFQRLRHLEPGDL